MSILLFGVLGDDSMWAEMEKKKKEPKFREGYKFKKGDICVFTNKGSSGVTKNDGKKCRIVAFKDGPEWRGLLDEPGYVIEFLDGSNSFGVRESELQPTNEEESAP